MLLSVTHRNGELKLNPNEFALLSGIPSVVKQLVVPFPQWFSELSNERGAVIFSDLPSLVVKLTLAELLDLAGLRLQPEQVLTLRSYYGDNFWWHDDFYDEAGEALQPRQALT